MRYIPALLLICSPAIHGQAHWNQWRGPERSGQCGNPEWPERLTADNCKQQWTVELGESYSGPVVDADRVYTTATVDKQREVVWAFDRRTGEELWEVSWSGAMSVPFFAASNGSWIRSTPALDEGRLYVAGMCDVLVCLDVEAGEEIWRVDFKARYGTPNEDFGFVCSPLVHGDAVYVQTAAGLIKLDKQTGESRWRGLVQGDSNMVNRGAFSSPVWCSIHGIEQLLVQGRQRLSGVDPATGEELWGVDVPTFRGMNILTPIPYQQGVFTSAYGGRARYYELTVVDEKLEVTEQWSNRAQGYMTSPVIVDEHAYLYLRSDRFACVDLQAGEVSWISDRIGDAYWSLVAQGDRILALTDTGQLLLIRADSEEFETVDRLGLSEESTWAHLAVDRGQVFVRGLRSLTAYAWE